MFADVSPTAFDLRFRLFGFPVRVNPFFWLVMALLGEFVLRRLGAPYLLVWVACGFVSILIHELGHAVMMRWFGSPAEIVLYAFGGLAIPAYAPAEAWKRLLIALAGPAAGFVLLGAVVAVGVFAPVGEGSGLEVALGFLFVMNLFWNLFNLLPIWPLDGGRVCRELCVLVRLPRPDVVSLNVSLVTAVLMTAYCVASLMRAVPPQIAAIVQFRPGLMMTLFMAVMAYESYQLLQQTRQQYAQWDDPDDDTPPWRR